MEMMMKKKRKKKKENRKRRKRVTQSIKNMIMIKFESNNDNHEK